MTEALDPRLHEKLEALRALLRSMEDVLVTFSGGVDSALVLKVAVDTLVRRFGPKARRSSSTMISICTSRRVQWVSSRVCAPSAPPREPSQPFRTT